MNDIIAAVKALGVAEADIQTTNLSLYPQYGTGLAPKIVGYQISEQIVVTVRDLDKAGDVVDAAIAKGANNVNGISFESGDPVKATERRASRRRGAARTSAQAMAARGQRLARRRDLDHRRLPSRSRSGTAGGLRPGAIPRPRDPGPAGHPGPDRHCHGGLLDQLVAGHGRTPSP